MSFSEELVTQAAGVLLRRSQGKMNYMKLLKLLYLAERKSLLEAKKLISGDRLVSMDNGPLLSATYDLIKASAQGQRDGYWCSHITTNNYQVAIVRAIEAEDLSDADERRLNAVYDEFGSMTERELVAWTHHNLPEWSDPQGSSREIPTREIFAAELGEEAVSSREKKLHERYVFEKAVGL